MAQQNEGYEPGSKIAKAIGVQRDDGDDAHVTLAGRSISTKAERALVGGYGEAAEPKQEQFEVDPNKDPADQVIKPRFSLAQLYGLIHQNNALGQLIAAMEVNVDGTGYEIQREDGEDSEGDETKAQVESFFSEPYPGIPFRKMRRELRRDLEATGNAYLEVIRNIEGSIVMLRRLPAESIALLRLSEPVSAKKTVRRGDTTETLTMPVRERRFVQKTQDGAIYFVEYGASRQVDRETGKWENNLAPEKRATELLHFWVHRDVHSPYGVPRWINQIPSILGARKAEELNLDFFNAGGLPPALIMVQGGTMGSETRRQLQNYLTGKGASRHRAAIVETYSTSGSIESGGAPVRVTVERFGAERQSDSMFETYDDKCEKRVRSSFRLPPLFVGRTEGFNFATAFASYTVAEAQVFDPEREEFDDIINMTVMRELAPGYVLRSNPLTVRDVETQLKAIGMARQIGGVGTQELLRGLNEVSNMDLQYDEESDPQQMEPPEPGDGSGSGGQQQGVQGRRPKQSATKGLSEYTAELAHRYGNWMRGGGDMTDEEAREVRKTVDTMGAGIRNDFDRYVAEVFFGYALEHDPSGAAEIQQEVDAIMHGAHAHGGA